MLFGCCGDKALTTPPGLRCECVPGAEREAGDASSTPRCSRCGDDEVHARILSLSLSLSLSHAPTHGV